MIEAIIPILTVHYPLSGWGFAVFAFVVLGLSALVDARTGRVPDILVIGGLVITLCGFAWHSDWFQAGERALYVAAVLIILYGVNRGYDHLTGHDAFGFGDVKWTALAVATFDVWPVVWAWVIGAALGLLWMAFRWVLGRVSPTYAGHSYVHFAPFLFIGLVVVLLVHADLKALLL